MRVNQSNPAASAVRAVLLMCDGMAGAPPARSNRAAQPDVHLEPSLQLCAAAAIGSLAPRSRMPR
jgi:hypothetical protein